MNQLLNLCIDKGNSSTKVALFKDEELLYDGSYELFSVEEFVGYQREYSIGSVIISNVGAPDIIFEDFLKKQNLHFILLDHQTALPVKNEYDTPETLGKDRLAAVVGATVLKPASNVLVVDAGTAITYDFVDSNGIYHGGNIAAGLQMRLKALHQFTKRLPLIKLNESQLLLGKNTHDAMLSGALNGIIFEIEGYFEALKIKYPELSIFLTGGDINYFVSKLKSPIFVEKNLVLIGLNRIIQFNVKK